jgi:ADP-glucose pyrophosphorylase
VTAAAFACGLLLQAYAFQGYWEDIGTIEAFYNANLALVKTDGSANFRWAGICGRSRQQQHAVVLRCAAAKDTASLRAQLAATHDGW